MIVADTTVVSEFMRESPDPSVMAWAQGIDPSALTICVATVEEIERGLGRLPDGRRRRNLDQRWRNLVAAYADSIEVYDLLAAQNAADILVAAAAAGRPMSLADGQIAAPIEASREAREAVRRALAQELALGRSGVTGADVVAGRAALLQATRIGGYLVAGEQATRHASPDARWQALRQGVVARISIYAFTLDGLECEALVDLREARVTVFDGRGMPVGEEPRQDGLWRYRLRYDLAAGRWKLADLLEYAPG